MLVYVIYYSFVLIGFSFNKNNSNNLLSSEELTDNDPSSNSHVTTDSVVEKTMQLYRPIDFATNQILADATPPSTAPTGSQLCVYCSCVSSKKCSLCKTPYCSEACQKEDWEKHKFICKVIQGNKVKI